MKVSKCDCQCMFKTCKRIRKRRKRITVTGSWYYLLPWSNKVAELQEVVTEPRREGTHPWVLLSSRSVTSLPNCLGRGFDEVVLGEWILYHSLCREKLESLEVHSFGKVTLSAPAVAHSELLG